jgi:regulation of enolase protein 1 (concanavalin A-like superfamily)
LEKLDYRKGQWIFKPKEHRLEENTISITTEPGTDFWQRSYYGFRNDNAHALLWERKENFTFTTKVEFNYKKQFDQCGVLIYLNSENWFKASIEFENDRISRLGSVVTNLGYSDWATTDMELPDSIWYRLSRRGPDFLIESSKEGKIFEQMRIFHLHKLGETTTEMGKANPPMPALHSIRFGVYACSPSNSSFQAVFRDFRIESSKWPAH